jgi:hypothetical protein
MLIFLLLEMALFPPPLLLNNMGCREEKDLDKGKKSARIAVSSDSVDSYDSEKVWSSLLSRSFCLPVAFAL